MTPRLRVVIDARLASGAGHGGVEQVLIGLAHGLSTVGEADEEYFFLTLQGADEWIRPYVHSSCRVIEHPRVLKRSFAPETFARALLKRVPGAAAAYRLLRRRRPSDVPPIPDSDGRAEALQPDVVHFPFQTAFRTGVPSIYHPWDLQHVHFPEFFTPEERQRRNLQYGAFCRQATIVSAPSEFVKRDLITNLGVEASKIEVVPMAAVLEAYETPSSEELAEVRLRLRLPQRFIFYPAQTWPHKNHLLLVEAMAKLKREGEIVDAVFSGMRNEFAATIDAAAERAGVSEQMHFVGFVSTLEVRCLYALATCLVFPSRFEGWGLPVTEAFAARLPVACSDAASLPEVCAGAALSFAPDDVDGLAVAIHRILADGALRRELVSRGQAVVSRLSWVSTANRFREIYRVVARGR